MIDSLVQIVVWLNLVANALGGVLLSPIGWLPDWLFATAVSAATGVFLLIVFKHTSNQRAVKRARDDIKADLLAVKLFNESVSVTLRAQGRILIGAFRLSAAAIVPMLVMIVPVSLLLGQLAFWYQSRPLLVGEEAVITLKLSGNAGSAWPHVRLQPTSAVAVTDGPVRVLSKREVCWNVQAREAGHRRVLFQVDGQTGFKALAIGDGFMRLSRKRPGWSWPDVLLHPLEPPFRPESPIESIEISYPDRESWTCGTDRWIVYWFLTSMVAAFCFHPLLKVSI
jgi:hypothetical protein